MVSIDSSIRGISSLLACLLFQLCRKAPPYAIPPCLFTKSGYSQQALHSPLIWPSPLFAPIRYRCLLSCNILSYDVMSACKCTATRLLYLVTKKKGHLLQLQSNVTRSKTKRTALSKKIKITELRDFVVINGAPFYWVTR